MSILGTSSDHLVLDMGDHIPAIGEEIAFGINYTTLLRAMTSPFVEKIMVADRHSLVSQSGQSSNAAPGSRGQPSAAPMAGS